MKRSPNCLGLVLAFLAVVLGILMILSLLGVRLNHDAPLPEREVVTPRSSADPKSAPSALVARSFDDDDAGYDAGYADGYEQGEYDAAEGDYGGSYDDGYGRGSDYSEGYDDGYNDGFDDY